MSAETLEQYQWQFRDTALWAVNAHSPAGGVTAIRRVLRDLQIEDMPIGPGAAFRNPYDQEDLPTGTILTQYQPGARNYRVWVKKGRRLEILLGVPRSGSTLLVVDTMPGGTRPAWLDVQPGPDETGRIEGWKKEAWKVGYKAKIANSWCPTFESVMGGLGVYAS